MRKIIIFVLSILMIFVLAGCASKKEEAPVPETDTSAPEQIGNASEGEGDRQEESVGWFSVKVAYANWGDETHILSECANPPEVLILSSERHLPVYLFKTKDDLDWFKEEFRDEFTMDRGYDEVPSFDEVTAEYDDAFFEKHSVLLTYVAASSGSFRYDVESIDLKDYTLCMNVYRTNDPEVYTSDMSGWFIMAELDPNVVERCTSFDAREVREGIDYKITSLPGMIEFGSFSWKEVERAMADLDESSKEHVKTEGFVNTVPVMDFLPYERAKAEATIDYKLIQYFHDEEEDMWKVRLFVSENGGPVEEVYMDGQGVTKLIIYADVARYG